MSERIVEAGVHYSIRETIPLREAIPTAIFEVSGFST